MTDALVKHQAMPVEKMLDLQTAGQLIAQSGLLGAKNPAEGFLIATTCHQTGMSLLKFGETYHVFNGKISMKSDAMLARFNELGGTHKVLSRTPELASIELTWNETITTFSFSWDEAKEEPFIYGGGPSKQMAELKKPFEERNLKDKYATPRSIMQMLWARVISDAIRCVCPQANQGSYTTEEVGDFNDAPRSSEPVVIPPDEVESRVVESESKAYPYGTDICPIGGPDYVGKRWDDLTTDMLDMALVSPDPLITEIHKEAIREVITRRMPF